MKTLQEEFEFIRKTFFPRWDRNGQWRIEVPEIPDSDCAGECLTKPKIIVIDHPPAIKEELQALLIHEISHAVSRDRPPYHLPEWENRMVKSCIRAADLGMNGLARCIWQHLKVRVEWWTKSQPSRTRCLESNRPPVSDFERKFREGERRREIDWRLMSKTLEVICAQESLH